MERRGTSSNRSLGMCLAQLASIIGLNRERSTSIATISTTDFANSQKALYRQTLNRDRRCIITRASRCIEATNNAPLQ